jgi:hypothetical protein
MMPAGRTRGRVSCPAPVIHAGNRTHYLGYRAGVWLYRCVARGGGPGYVSQDECFEDAVVHGQRECEQ